MELQRSIFVASSESLASSVPNHEPMAEALYVATVTGGTSGKTKLMDDNLHPNDSGYVALGQMWYAAIKGILPTGP